MCQREIVVVAPARKKNIPSAWVFVLLGHVVAVSFAANMSFLAILCSAAPGEATSEEEEETKGRSRPKVGSAFPSHTIVLFATLLWATSIPSAVGGPGFLAFLLGPHLLAFAPLVLNEILLSRALADPSGWWKASSMVWVLAVAMKGLLDEGKGLRVAWSALYEHPAVSSVGWDVMCCWLSFGRWHFLGDDRGR